MILSENLNVYLKTTETCNLNCSHCFTSGSNGAKIFFKPEKVINFFTDLSNQCPWVKNIKFNFHGGEPMLAPLSSLYEAHAGLKDLFPSVTFGMQTNLVYPLTPEKRKFFKDILYEDGFGTSWDEDIRFGSGRNGIDSKLKQKHIALWEENVKILCKEDDHYLTMIVCITKNLIKNRSAIDVVNYAIELGFKNILFERITHDGNANDNSDVIPSNEEQDKWIYQMFLDSLKEKSYKKIGNMFLSELATAFLSHVHSGNRCRNCEQSLLTINAGGTIAGCPNSAPHEHWGNLDLPLYKNLTSKGRLTAINHESFDRHEDCYSCEAFEYCNSDCQKLAWDLGREGENYCPAPKNIWKHMIKENDVDAYKNLLLDNNAESAHGV